MILIVLRMFGKQIKFQFQVEIIIFSYLFKLFTGKFFNGLYDSYCYKDKL